VEPLPQAEDLALGQEIVPAGHHEVGVARQAVGAMAVQLRVGDFRLDAGDQVIALGGIDAYEQKLDKLMSFYRKAVLYEGWDRYRYVNLKYKDQIVCVK